LQKRKNSEKYSTSPSQSKTLCRELGGCESIIYGIGRDRMKGEKNRISLKVGVETGELVELQIREPVELKNKLRSMLFGKRLRSRFGWIIWLPTSTKYIHLTNLNRIQASGLPS